MFHLVDLSLSLSFDVFICPRNIGQIKHQSDAVVATSKSFHEAFETSLSTSKRPSSAQKRLWHISDIFQIHFKIKLCALTLKALLHCENEKRSSWTQAVPNQNVICYKLVGRTMTDTSFICHADEIGDICLLTSGFDVCLPFLTLHCGLK